MGIILGFTLGFIFILFLLISRMIRHVAYLSFQVRHLSKNLNIDIPNTLADIFHLYNFSEDFSGKLEHHLKNNDDHKARILLKKHSNLSDFDIENIIISAQYLTPQKSYFRRLFL